MFLFYMRQHKKMNPKPVATDLGISYTRTLTYWLGALRGLGGSEAARHSPP